MAGHTISGGSRFLHIHDSSELNWTSHEKERDSDKQQGHPSELLTPPLSSNFTYIANVSCISQRRKPFRYILLGISRVVLKIELTFDPSGGEQ
jgi:hypothetical protein